MNDKKNLGYLGELIASKYLEKNGFVILEKNWRFKKLEVDIIASLAGRLVFFEIKTRFNNLSSPEENLKIKQIKNLKKAIFFYCGFRKIDIEFSRLDFIFISLNRKMKVVKAFHYKNILD
ncbi:MAG: YraN family protein [Patescibacteria group bacterium]|nr:YraN family protein [Patescibacteria group bacterium]